jgi:hypothetical protein
MKKGAGTTRAPCPAPIGWPGRGGPLQGRVGLDPATAREKARVARALGKLPAIDEAFRSATLSYAKVRALTRVATPETEGRLLELALVATAAQLEPGEYARQAPVPRLPGGAGRGGGAAARGALGAQAPAGGRDGQAGAGASPTRPTWCCVPSSARGRYRRRAFPRKVHSPRGPMARSGSPSRSWPVLRRAGVTGRAPRSWCTWSRSPWPPTANGRPRWRTGRVFPRKYCDPSPATAVSRAPGRRSRSIPPPMRRALMARDRGCVFPGCTHR